MKFTDGLWQLRPGVTALYAAEAHDIWAEDGTVTVTAPTTVIHRRGDTLNRPVLSLTLSSPLPDVIRVRVDHHVGGGEERGFELLGAEDGHGVVKADDTHGATLTSGALSATIAPGAPWNLSFHGDGRPLTSSGHKSIGYFRLADDAHVDPAPVGAARSSAHLAQQLSLGAGEAVYGLGERFGPLVKNGQTVEIWNADGGTSSEQAYKNVPFYLTSRGYGVFVNHPGHVSYEIGSEAVQRAQFSVAGESLEYFVIYGPTPKRILERYTALTGRPARLPAWSYGLWLSTSFTTDYDERTVSSFIDGMAERDLPLSVFHFDCFWMREFNWCDFAWDPRVFPDPEGMLARLRAKDLRVCVWINPYIAQRSPLFAEAAERGSLLKRPDGSVWQWDLWQPGMGLVDFTDPEATRWFQSKLRALQIQGVDAFKTDFGERIPLDVAYFDGSTPERMHNLYTHLYNTAVFEVLEEQRGQGEAVLFARSATAGGQRLPVHWGGDTGSSYESMAETLRGGLSLAFSGFSFWSHDIGGFEGTPDPGVFKRWVAFGLMSSHSRFHGSSSYRVPWAFDEEAVEVTRLFTKLKLRLMPYLFQVGVQAHETGTPVMRPMAMEFPEDRNVAHLDTQYMLGPDLLIAPVFSPDGTVEVYLPDGTWTNHLTGERVEGGRWRTETHGFTSMPIYVREGAVLPIGARDDRPDYDYLDGLTLRVYPGPDGETTLTVTDQASGESTPFTITRSGGQVSISSSRTSGWTYELA
ncbi:alpha-xylosidase [Nonomuraea aurantiaca]|uniref:alpha-xylosidase n=1 Tax=Nonomuraea aurantiaca TaxID=2878562 RepID=UPI001CDA44CB|nr:alpha-xylosidase [Nonomuraea aurantiaca]MCA2222475.1 alpha-xylosidase [Nonomuraea aurantiaca]